MTTVAVNHPYFYPYAGYYRLMASADVLVLFDCVPFPRRGYVHRNRLPNIAGNLEWFSLSLKKQHRDTLIKDIRFTNDIELTIQKNIRKFPSLFVTNELNRPLLDRMTQLSAEHLPIDFLVKSLEEVRDTLGFKCCLIRSSSLAIAKDLHGQARVLKILEYFNTQTYINAPGGRHLYDADLFFKSGIELAFLKPYEAPSIQEQSSILHRLLSEDHTQLKNNIQEQCQWQK